VIDKSIVKNNIEKFVWAGAKNVYLHPTGGTTGSPLFMRTTRDEEMYNFALYEDREKNEFGIKTGMKNAVFLGKRIVSESQKKPPYWRHSYPLNQVMYSVYHMDNNTLKYYIEHLRNWNPDYITGYVSAIYMLSKYLLDQKIEPLHIKATFLSSETLHDFQKEIIEKALQTSICNGYSMAEYTAFISNCKENNLHIHEDYGYVELHNTGYEGIKEVVATTLFNYTMPLIRYRTYDYVEVSTNFTCSCGNNGRTAIKKIIGRDDSFIKTREGRLISSAALSLIFKKYPEIEQTQIIQEDFDNLVVHIICNKISDDSLNSFRDDIRFNCGNNFNIKIETVNEILKTSNGKSRLIISRMD
jgi:phenylacetate-CoA ligase